jgi:threonine dehydratase
MPTLSQLEQARARILPFINRTPLLRSTTLSEELGCQVWIKAEMFQKTGSFKPRGMLNYLMALDPAVRARGVITFSAGNAAQGLAYAARIAGAKAVVAMPEFASPAKVEATRGYGAEFILHGANAAETFQRCMEVAQARGLYYLPSYDDPLLMEGHASLGLEIVEDAPDVAAVFCGIGGGGLIGGVAMALRAAGSRARLIGVEPGIASCMTQALQAGHPVQVSNGKSLADGLAPPIAGKHCLPLVQHEVEQIVLVSEAQIADALSTLLLRCKLLAEGAGAAPLAGLRARADWGFTPADKVVLVAGGGNIDPARLKAALQD